MPRYWWGHCEFLIQLLPRLYWLQIQTKSVNQRRRIKNILLLSLSAISSSGSSRHRSISREVQAEWLGQPLPLVEGNSWTRTIRTRIFLPAKRQKQVDLTCQILKKASGYNI